MRRNADEAERQRVAAAKAEQDRLTKAAAEAEAKRKAARIGAELRYLGLALEEMSDDLRTRYKIKDSVRGVVITSVDGTSDAADKRLSAGDVIIGVAQVAVSSAFDIKERVELLKSLGRRSVRQRRRRVTLCGAEYPIKLCAIPQSQPFGVAAAASACTCVLPRSLSNPSPGADVAQHWGS
jgi:PDZ domain